MAKSTKIGASPETREARRRMPSGHLCARCGEMVAQGDLCMVQVMDLGNGRRRQKIPYHRKCYTPATA